MLEYRVPVQEPVQKVLKGAVKKVEEIVVNEDKKRKRSEFEKSHEEEEEEKEHFVAQLKPTPSKN